MRPGLVFTMGLAVLMDLCMLIFLSAPILAKILLIPLIGMNCLAYFIAGHCTRDDRRFAYRIILFFVIITGALILLFLPATYFSKSCLITNLFCVGMICFAFGFWNEETNKMIGEGVSEEEYASR